MPDPRTLKVGDRVRFVSLPEEWSESGFRIQADSVAFMERLIARTWPSRVSEIDETTGYPWIEARIHEPDGIVYHFWMITETTGWRRVMPRRKHS